MNALMQCAVTADLRAHEYQQVEADHRAKAISRRAAEMVEIGGDCYPWTMDNFREAIGNCKEIDLGTAIACIAAAAIGSNLNNPYANQYALSELQKTVEKYWLGVAMYLADREIKI